MLVKKTFLKANLDKNQPIAFAFSPYLGDSLINLVTINNLLRNGYEVDVYGDFAYAMRKWFPKVKIFPTIPLEKQHDLAKYHTVLHLHHSELLKAMSSWHPNSVSFADCPYSRLPITKVDIQVMICKNEFKLQDVVNTNGIVVPKHLFNRRYKKRVVLHPASQVKNKIWSKEKFIKLATILRDAGFEPVFITSPNERSDWLDVIKLGFSMPEFPTLSDVASFIYESAYFIGNDSGIGHLASNLNIPTVSIIARKGIARQWHPCWAPHEIVLSPDWLNPRPIKEKFWRHFISVNMVLRKFNKILQRPTN